MGGRNLLDIVTRNEAIAITWLKSYLNFGEDRALWAYVADEVIAKKALASDLNIEEALRRNMYLQEWRAKIIGEGSLKGDLKKMVQVGNKYNVQMEALAISRKAQREAIIWYHKKSNGTKSMFNKNQVNDCLRNKHKVDTVGDAEVEARKTKTTRHTHRKDCKCDACKVARTTVKCRHPQLCFTKARTMLMTLDPKWNPLFPHPEDYETENTRINEADARENTGENSLTFDTKITQDTLTDTFRIFTEQFQGSTSPPYTKMEPEPDEEPIAVYTDGSATDNGRDNPQAGSGIFFGAGDNRNRAIKIPEALDPSNQVGEIIA
ncbi:hypothetical protein B0H19DRAFT_948378, partial [Mycena capillaripes]